MYMYTCIGFTLNPFIVSAAAISACAKHERTCAVSLHLLDRMAAQRVEPNAYAYAGALSACATLGDSVMALALLEQMKRNGVKPEVRLD